MKKSLLVTVVSFLFLINSQLFGNINILSPISGVWCNKQMLVLDSTGDGDYFYSVDGSDPASFGFAYDGPVLLDVEGDVTLKITKVISRNKKEDAEVKYSVTPDDAAATSYASFISSFYDSGIINYTAGSQLPIPESLFFSFGLPPDAFMKGQTVSLSEKSVLTRSIPCVLWDKATNKKWRLIVKTFPLSAGAFSRRDLPIKVTDWETVDFVDKNLIYKIDSQMWGLPKEPVKLDRSVSHMISWQNISYEFGNPVEFIILPPKPQVSVTETEEGELKVSIPGKDNYKLSVLDQDDSYQELFDELGVDVFYGDKVEGNLKVGIFCNGLLQGTTEVPYALNKRPSAMPVITSSAQNFYTRQNVKLTIQGSGKGSLYYAVSQPYAVAEKRYLPDDQELRNVEAKDFVKAASNTVELEFSGLKDSGVYYKVKAYSSNGINPSECTEYNVIIDQYNYYFDSTVKTENADGTAAKPFNDFAAMLKYLNMSRSVKLRVNGHMVIPAGKNILTSNCVVTGTENASIEFEPEAQLIIQNSTFEVSKMTIKNKKDSLAIKNVPMIKGDRTNLIFTDCLMYGDFEKNGTIIDAVNSNVYIDKSICAVACSSYASFVSGVNSKINIKNSNLNATADTCVLISMSEGEINCKKNTFKISGKAGRIAELFTVTGCMENNVFKGELSKASKAIVPVFMEKGSKVTLNNNENYGF